MKKEVLVIHPDDRSTDFLKPIYENIPNKVVITGNFTYDEVSSMIDEHEKIIMLGHGSPWGLFSMGRFSTPKGYIIDLNMVQQLSNKPQNIYIWCNADMFMNQHPTLKGFYSGMFISEVGEAKYMGVFGTNQEIIDESNNGFSEILGKYSNENVETIYENVKNEYYELSKKNKVADYNCKRLYKR